MISFYFWQYWYFFGSLRFIFLPCFTSRIFQSKNDQWGSENTLGIFQNVNNLDRSSYNYITEEITSFFSFIYYRWESSGSKSFINKFIGPGEVTLCSNIPWSVLIIFVLCIYILYTFLKFLSLWQFKIKCVFENLWSLLQRKTIKSVHLNIKCRFFFLTNKSKVLR